MIYEISTLHILAYYLLISFCIFLLSILQFLAPVLESLKISVYIIIISSVSSNSKTFPAVAARGSETWGSQ